MVKEFSTKEFSTKEFSTKEFSTKKILHFKELLKFFFTDFKMDLSDINQEEVHFRTLLKLAQDGFHSIQYLVGMMYWEGRGVEKNQVECLRWIYTAKEANHPVAILQYDGLASQVAKDQSTSTPVKRKRGNKEVISKFKKILNSTMHMLFLFL